MSRLLISLSVIACVLLPDVSYAFTPYTSPANPDVPLRWFVRKAEVVFDVTAPQDIVMDAAVAAVKKSMSAWIELSCDDGDVPFLMTFGDVVSGKQVGYFSGANNENLIKWVSSLADWRHGSGVLAITSLTYDTTNGQIVDADIEFNDAEFDFSVDANKKQADLPNTAVHETGHFLGLDHSTIPAATMDASAPLGEKKKRSLHPDDVAGYCFLYGTSNAPLGADEACWLEPGPDCTHDSGTPIQTTIAGHAGTASCNVSRQRQENTQFMWLYALVIVGLLVVKQRFSPPVT